MAIPTSVRAPLLLCLGNDPALLHTRRLLLQANGYDVLTRSSREVLDLPLPSGLNGVIVCHSVNQEQLKPVLAWLENRVARDKILLIEPFSGTGRSLERSHTTSPGNPGRLLQSVSQMLRTPGGSVAVADNFV